MRHFPLAATAVFVSLLLMLSGGGLAESVARLWEQMGGTIGMSKLTANLNSAVDRSGSAGLLLAEAQQVEKAWGQQPVAYSVCVQASVRHDSSTAVTADVIGISAAYDRFETVWLKEGSTIRSASVEAHSQVAAVSAELAYQLFGSETVVGRQIQLFGSTFTVIGVFERAPSLLRSMTDDGRPDVWLPVTTLLDLNPNTRITTMQFAAKADSKLRGEQDIRAALSAAGKQPDSYMILNGLTERKRLSQKPAFTSFAIGIVVMVIAVGLVLRQIRQTLSWYRSELLQSDWQDVWRSGWRHIARRGAVVVMLLSAAGSAWVLIRFPLYVAPDHVPDNWIDWSFYEGLIRSAWLRQIRGAGYVPSDPELLTARADFVTTWLSCGGLAGIPLGWLGLREWVNGGMPAAGIATRYAGMLTLASVIALGFGWWGHFPYTVRYEDLVLLILFMAGIIVYPEWRRRKEKGREMYG